MTIWKLKRGHDRRFRQGHPWVYSNEIGDNIKNITPGQAVELRDASGAFLARGYGNPHSLIAFRALSRDASVEDPVSTEQLTKKLEKASAVRRMAGLAQFSHRAVFGEADGLPGFVLDRYVTEKGHVFVVQCHTAGSNAWLPQIEALLRKIATDWERTTIVIRNDLSVRKLEGLVEEAPRVLKLGAGVTEESLKNSVIYVRPAFGAQKDCVPFHCDLFSGQKTGFFLDQASNIELAASRLRGLAPSGKVLRILDLCCYVGQWSVQLGRAFKANGVQVHTTLVDASSSALDFAKANAGSSGIHCEALKADVMNGLGDLPAQSFDIVICDPPALIKGRKDIPGGMRAYLKLNTEVFRIVRSEGAVVSCSCSGLFEEEEFIRILSKASLRNGRDVRFIGRGGHSPDHPMRLEFPEGRYLKAWIGLA